MKANKVDFSTGLRMAAKSVTAFVLLFSLLKSAHAQETLNELTVDRPGIAEAPFTVSPGMFQLETGFEYYNRAKGEVFFLPVSLFRTGLSKNAELRITARNTIDRQQLPAVRGLAPLTVGVKTHIIEQRKWIPETDILVDLILPLGKQSDLQPPELGHDVLLLFQNDLSNKWALNYNVGLIWDGFSNQSLFTASFCVNFLPTDRVGLFAEYYDFVRAKTAEHGIDMGLTYLILPMLQADLSAGISRLEGKLNYFLASGISVRINAIN